MLVAENGEELLKTKWRHGERVAGFCRFRRVSPPFESSTNRMANSTGIDLASAVASLNLPPLFPDPWFLGLWFADGWFNKCLISVGNAEEGTVGEKLKLYAASIYMDVHVQQ
ncbi:hypothetical protein PPROV_000787300 [Pycnococcus provasolii]|uniref:Uncharacterized protein n=1 Tax=Pycnococcus provasolii TaxID=41880 RepID=A0A830HNV3_9CHLO|nr:hypothetical protein PPROV_000787300 [Pycnococcus provasolii]